MFRLPIVFFVCFAFTVDGQSLSGPATANNYTISQKRLLAVSTARFIDMITVNALDDDSLMRMACQLTGLPFLQAYNEWFYNKGESGASMLINAGKIAAATQMLKGLVGEKRIQLSVELAIAYLHRPGRHRTDLDSAHRYIQRGLELSAVFPDKIWQYGCLNLLGQYFHQSGNQQECNRTFMRLVSLAGGRDKNTTAQAWHNLGVLSEVAEDTSGLTYLNKSLLIYQQLQNKEKEIELLSEMGVLHLKDDILLTEKNFLRVLALQETTGFKHSLYVKYILSHVNVMQPNYLKALNYANAAMENMTWSGIPISATFSMRVGVAYWVLGKNEEALAWFKKGLENRSNDTHFFWYKSLLYAATILPNMNRTQEALSMIETVSMEFPPRTLWENIQILSLKGWCYEKLANLDLADKYYTTILNTIKRTPLKDNEITDTYWLIANFYISQKSWEKARSFLNEASLTASYRNTPFDPMNSYLSFRIDSAEGNYKSAMLNHIKFKAHSDSVQSMDQRKKFDELTMRYGAEKKDQDIKLLKQQEVVRQIESQQNKRTRNIMIAVSGLLLIILGLVFNQFRLKQRTNREVNKTNAALQKMIEEKEWLLKEVHHRVKNNLQIMISLLNTQANYLDNDAAVKAITESQERMHAISLIHQKLYNSEDTAFINFNEYVHELVQHIRNGFSRGSAIEFEIDITNIQLDVAQAVPLGLILNEAISNSIKYGFPDGSQGLVNISITHSINEDAYILIFTDNGVGFTTHYDLSKMVSFGMRLMQGLSKQLGGSFKIESNTGVRIEISFKASKITSLIRDQNVAAINV